MTNIPKIVPIWASEKTMRTKISKSSSASSFQMPKLGWSYCETNYFKLSQIRMAGTSDKKVVKEAIQISSRRQLHCWPCINWQKSIKANSGISLVVSSRMKNERCSEQAWSMAEIQLERFIANCHDLTHDKIPAIYEIFPADSFQL